MKITRTKTYQIIEPLQSPVEVMFMNRKGGFDLVQFNRNRDTDIKFKAGVHGSYGAQKVYSVASTRTEVYHSTPLVKATYEWLVNDLLTSPAVYINGKYVRLLDQSVKYDNLQKLYTIELEVAPEREQNNIRL